MPSHPKSSAARRCAPAALAVVGVFAAVPAGGITATSPGTTPAPAPGTTPPVTASTPPAPYPFYVSILDTVGFAGQDKPDTVNVYSWPDSVKVTIERGGTVIASSASNSGSVQLADLQAGDAIVVRNLGPYYYSGYPVGYPGYPGYPAVTRYVYQPKPALDTPLCAGAASYTGTVNAGATASMWATATLWKADPEKTGTGTTPYPWVSPPYPESAYPGWYPGYAVADAAQLDLKSTDGDRFTLVPRKPLVAGMRVRFGDYGRVTGPFNVSTTREQVVEDCTPKPTPTPTASPAPTSAATPVVTAIPVATPVPDKTPPKGTVVAPSVKALKKLGAKKLLKTGIPLTLTVDGPAQLKGQISLLGGKVPIRGLVSIPLKTGKSSIKVTVPNALRKGVKKVNKKKTPKLQLKLSLFDAAGNATPLKTITIKLPK